MDFDRTQALEFLNQAGQASMELSPDQLGPANDVRVALQAFALMEGMTEDLSRMAMRVAKSLKAIEEEGVDVPQVLDDAMAVVCELQERVEQGDLYNAAPAPAMEGSAAPDLDDLPTTMSVTDDPLLAEFIDESEEHLDTAEEHLLTIESDPTDADALNAVFRSFHTIKGAAGVLEIGPLSVFAHRAESLLDMARDHEIELVGEAMELCYGALDTLKSMVQSMRGADGEVPLPEGYGELLRALEAVGSEATGSHAAPAATPAPVTPVEADAPSVTDASSSALIASEDALPLDDVVTPEAVQDIVQPAERKSAPQEATNVAAAKPKERSAKDAPKRSSSSSSVKVATDRLDNMINLVGELVITTAMVQQDVLKSIPAGQNMRSVAQLSKVTSELQHFAMSMRMVPLKATFQKAARMVRDVAIKCGKKVTFESNGEDTELDRNVVEQLGDPLIHMLRNAIDHGLEAPEERVAAGKSESGTVILRAYHQGGGVVIELEDDGAGINRDALLKKALGNGLVTPQEAQSMPDADVWQLVFHPGLSTTQELSEISGRGVGMDVVKKNIESLRGTVEIESQRGKGTRFTIRLPLTLAIIDAMVVLANERNYILPTLSIQSFIRPEPDQIFSVQGKGEVVNVRGQVMPLHRLHDVLGIESSLESPCDGLLAITHSEGEAFALLVDDLHGQQQVVIKSMGSHQEQCPAIAGAAILGDGTVGLILDTDGIARIAREQSAHLVPA